MTVGLAGCAGLEGSLRDNINQADGYGGQGIRGKAVVSGAVEPRLISFLIEDSCVLTRRVQRWSWMEV